MAPPLVVTPVAGFNHSTFSARVVALRFTVNVPPLGAYTRYSAPVAALSARQNPVDDRLPCGIAFSKSILAFTYCCAYPMPDRNLSYFASTPPVHTLCTGLPCQ